LTHYQDSPQEDTAKSCYFECFVDKETGAVMFECGWGDSDLDLDNFAFMLKMLNKGKYESVVLEEIGNQCGDNETKLQQYFTLLNKYEALFAEEDSSSVAIKPSRVNP
jgi:hypothetical protein